jgi:redox-sensitive bicupin YhaK (pirin superfamily)
MLDHFKLSESTGFPDHPHRGQETITYMLKGRMDHEDFTGGKGSIGPGDLQFMTAGNGIVHAEIPRIDKKKDGDIGVVEGIQLWIDLPETQKHTKPRYRDLRASEIPVAKDDSGKVEVKVISGKSLNVDSVKDLAYTPLWFLDVKISPGGGYFQQAIPKDHNSVLYILEGKLSVDKKVYSPYFTLLLGTEGDGIEVSTVDKFTRFILLTGKILHQPIFQQGPFVETSEFQLDQAYFDYNSFSNGFERAENWESEISKRLPRKKNTKSLIFRFIRYLAKLKNSRNKQKTP